MSALEIVAIVVLCIFGITNILVWGQVTILFNEFLIKQRKEKKPASKTETDNEK